MQEYMLEMWVDMVNTLVQQVYMMNKLEYWLVYKKNILVYLQVVWH